MESQDFNRGEKWMKKPFKDGGCESSKNEGNGFWKRGFSDRGHALRQKTSLFWHWQ